MWYNVVLIRDICYWLNKVKSRIGHEYLYVWVSQQDYVNYYLLLKYYLSRKEEMGKELR